MTEHRDQVTNVVGVEGFGIFRCCCCFLLSFFLSFFISTKHDWKDAGLVGSLTRSLACLLACSVWRWPIKANRFYIWLWLDRSGPVVVVVVVVVATHPTFNSSNWFGSQQGRRSSSQPAFDIYSCIRWKRCRERERENEMDAYFFSSPLALMNEKSPSALGLFVLPYERSLSLSLSVLLSICTRCVKKTLSEVRKGVALWPGAVRLVIESE